MEEIEFKLPMLGTLDKEQVFDYFILKLTSQSALIAIQPAAALISDAGNRVQLHLDEYFSLGPNRFLGTLLPVSPQASLYKVKFAQPLPGHFMFQNKRPATEAQVIQEIIAVCKKLLLIKEGINVHMQHLIPFFSRLLNKSQQEYGEIKEAFLGKMHDRIKRDIDVLQNTYRECAASAKTTEFFQCLDLDQLREACKSELDHFLLRSSCNGIANLKAVLKGSEDPLAYRSYQMYLQSVKKLESNLYMNYNKVALGYAAYLKTLLKPDLLPSKSQIRALRG